MIIERTRPVTSLIRRLDELATVVAKTIPLYVPEAGKYAIHNAAEEALMKSKVTDIADFKVFRIGLASLIGILKKTISAFRPIDTNMV